MKSKESSLPGCVLQATTDQPETSSILQLSKNHLKKEDATCMKQAGV